MVKTLKLEDSIHHKPMFKPIKSYNRCDIFKIIQIVFNRLQLITSSPSLFITIMQIKI